MALSKWLAVSVCAWGFAVACDSSYGAAGPSDAGIAPSLSLFPAELDLEVPCGAPATSGVFTISNNNDSPIDYRVDVSEGAPVRIEDNGAPISTRSGALPPRGTTELKVVSVTNSPGTVTATLIVSSGDTAISYPIKVVTRGGSLSLSPTTVDFGSVRLDSASEPQPIEIANSGTEPVTITDFNLASADFTIEPRSLTIAPGATEIAQTTLVAGPAGAPLDVVASPVTIDPLCEAPPSLELTGQRENIEVTVTPATVNFGDLPCTTTASRSRTLTISNYSPSAPAQFTIDTSMTTLVNVSPTSGVVPTASSTVPGKVAVTISSKAMPAKLGAISERLSVTTAGLVTKTRSINLAFNLVGVILQMRPAALANFRANQTKVVTITNAGNRQAVLAHNVAAPFTVTPSSTIAAGASSTMDVTLATTTPGTYSGNVRTTRAAGGGTFCVAPQVVTASGTVVQ